MESSNFIQRGVSRMAHIESQREKGCACGSCPTSATVTKYSCGCVTVEIHDETDPCDDCSNLSGLAEECGQSGDPENHDE